MSFVGYNERTSSVAGIDRDVFEILAQNIIRQEFRMQRGVRQGIFGLRQDSGRDPFHDLSRTSSRIQEKLNLNQPLDADLMEDYVRNWIRLFHQTGENNYNALRRQLQRPENAYNSQTQASEEIAFFSNLIVMLLKFVIGIYNFNECPAGKLIPMFLIAEAFRFLLSTILIRPISRLIQGRMTSEDFDSFRGKVFFYWNCFGGFLAWRAYQRMDKDAADSLSPNYCNTTLLYFAVFSTCFNLFFV